MHNPTSYKPCYHFMKGTCKKVRCPFYHPVPDASKALQKVSVAKTRASILASVLKGEDQDGEGEIILKAIRFICAKDLFTTKI